MTTGSESWIDVSAIEHELTALWREASEEEDHGVIRSCILNLLVYVSNESGAAEMDDLLADITASHPSRAILIVADPDADKPKLEAQVTSRCTLPIGTRKQVCCEQVTITAAGAGLADVPSAIAPLLLSDLPVYLWWRPVPRIQEKALFRKLADVSDRVIIDSALFNDPHWDIVSMASLEETPRSPSSAALIEWTAVSDLNWARLTAWRALLAGFYDVPQYRPLLDQVDEFVIEYAPPSGSSSAISARALLLGGWLASRLGWRAQSKPAIRTDDSTRVEFTVDDRAVTLEFAQARREIEPGHLALVTMRSEAEQSVSFAVRRSADAQRIETSVSRDDEKLVQRVLSYEALGEAELIGRELEILGHDRVYEQAVLSAGDLVRAMSSAV